ncbi:MAG: hypothetical protein A4E56_01900 [Pelotomaculum sp. PtaU1.Bin065]|nr:MAG: hypothetical protein A4E56_01900 [Pelotomaculum sp. PtaU1.Bin065]
MKIILENSFEKWAWGMMIKAHSNFEKKKDLSLCEHMGRFFNDLCREETEHMIANEVESRLVEEYGVEVFDVIEVDEKKYVQKGVNTHYEECAMSEDDLQQLIVDLVEEYRSFNRIYKNFMVTKEDEIREELTHFYYTFFNAPQNLTVIYKDEIIQEAKR